MQPLPNKKYQIIYADPPWKFSDRAYLGKNIKFRSLDFYYQTMKTEDICKIPIKDITDDKCVLFIWTTNAHLSDALKVINVWGFKYKTIGFIWIKKSWQKNLEHTVGKWVLSGGEICLLATKGKAHSLIKSRKVRQVIECERGQHSKKPDEVRDRIVELLGDLPRIELFARESFSGWDVWGNETTKFNKDKLCYN